MSSKTYRVSELSDAQPRERLVRRGAESLSDTELLACVLGSTSRRQNPIAVADSLLVDGLGGLARQDFNTHRHLATLGLPTASRLAAVLEFARRLRIAQGTTGPWLTDFNRIASYLQARAAHWPQERVGALLLTSRLRLLADREIVRGSLETATVAPRDVLRCCLVDNAASFILYHSHPSGDPTPSRDDITFTRALSVAARHVGLRFLDHVVVGREGCVSLAARGDLDL